MENEKPGKWRGKAKTKSKGTAPLKKVGSSSASVVAVGPLSQPTTGALQLRHPRQSQPMASPQPSRGEGGDDPGEDDFYQIMEDDYHLMRDVDSMLNSEGTFQRFQERVANMTPPSRRAKAANQQGATPNGSLGITPGTSRRCPSPVPMASGSPSAQTHTDPPADQPRPTPVSNDSGRRSPSHERAGLPIRERMLITPVGNDRY